MLGHFTACPVDAVYIGPLAPISSVAATSWRTHRLCALCVSLFPSIRSALDSHASSLVPNTPSLSFLSSFGDPTARTPSSSRAPSYLLSFISHPLACAGSTSWPCLSPQHEPSVFPIHITSTSGVLRPTSIHHYKIPLVLVLLLHPIPSHSEQSYEIQSSLVELGSSVWGEEKKGSGSSKKFKFPWGRQP